MNSDNGIDPRTETLATTLLPRSSYHIVSTSTTTTANLHTLTLGTGHSILSGIFDTILQTLERELLFVTCFWAPSPSLDSFNDLLRALSARALSRPNGPRFHVRICFSSLSLTQKLFHTPSKRGQTYPPSCWERTLGLPPEEELRGLDLQIKSLFMAPFSVLHPKFVVVDRERCFLPSCNVSWERWLEGCVEMTGPVVGCFVRFWEEVWGFEAEEGWVVDWSGLSVSEGTGEPEAGASTKMPREDEDLFIYRPRNGLPPHKHDTQASTHVPLTVALNATTPQTVLFLPSQYHRNPRFRPFPWQLPAEPPKTPLNTTLLTIFREAQSSIFIQTPNVTSPPVLSALRDAISRGVDITIVTNERLMRIEQIVTAGTTTPRCLARLIEAHTQLARERGAKRTARQAEEAEGAVGRLEIFYFSASSATGGLDGQDSDSLPVSTHFKVTVVDEEVVVLGSGNMDRASWYTSQEVGVAVKEAGLAKVVREAVWRVDGAFVKVLYSSG